MDRREFLNALAIAAAAGLPLDSRAALAGEPKGFYNIPKFGNASLLHFTDCHAQLKPIHFREPNVNIGIGAAAGRPPHLVGEHLLKAFGIRPGSGQAHAFTYLDFVQAAKTFGMLGGFAHLATLVKQLRASRPGALLLDGGDTWQGSATALWTNGQDMVDAQLLLGVDVMTAHWEFTLGAKRVKEVVDRDFKGKVDFVAQNVSTTDFGDPVFAPYVIKQVNGVSIAIIGQAFPYTPIANPRYFVEEWSFGIKEAELQKQVEEVREKGAQVVVLLSHNGMDVDLKLAGRVTGIDVILGGHTHDGVPAPVPVQNAGGRTLVTNAGSNGKFLARGRLRRARRQASGHRVPAAAGVRQPARAGCGDGRADREAPRALREEARRETRGHRRPALSPRQLQRHLRPVDPRCADGDEGRRDRLFAGLPLGHVDPAGRGDHDGARDGPDGDHLSLHDGERIHRAR